MHNFKGICYGHNKGFFVIRLLQILLQKWEIHRPSYCFLWLIIACTFYSTTKEYPSSDTESGKFIRIKEDHAIGDDIIMFDVYPR